MDKNDNLQKIIIHVDAYQTKNWNLSDWNAEQLHSNLQIDFYLQDNSVLYATVALINQSQINLTLNIYLQGLGSIANIFGLYALRSQQKVKIQTLQMHQTLRTTSNIVFKGLLHDQALAQVHGLVHIAEHAKGSKAGQQNQNILLSAQAHAVSQPSLEVLNHDVQCSHGAATSQLNDDYAWYLYARGLHQHQAYKLLMQSFLFVVVKEFKDSDFCMEKIWQKMI